MKTTTQKTSALERRHKETIAQLDKLNDQLATLKRGDLATVRMLETIHISMWFGIACALLTYLHVTKGNK